jgi:restriction endonuclease S subunit
MTLVIDKSNWNKLKFGTAIESITKRIDNPSEAGVDRYVGLEHLDPGSMKINRWGTPDQVEATKLLFKNGDVIFGRRRAYQKKVSMADFNGICSAHALVLRGKNGIVDPLFLPVFLSSDTFLERAIKISVGSLSPTVNWKSLAAQEFLFPPIDQQVEIAKLFWSIENSIESKKNLAAKLVVTLDRFIKAEIEKCISVKPLPSVADVLDSQRIPVNSAERNLRSGSVAYYGAGGQVGWIDEAIFDEDLVLVGEDATLEVYRIYGPSWVNNHAHVLRGKTISNDWLFYVLSRMDLKSKATNGTRLKLTQAALNGIDIPIPTQEEVVVARIREIEQLINLNRIELEEEKKLRSALNVEFFGGAS